VDFSAISFGLGDAQFMVGNFINAVIKFVIVAWVVFLLVKSVNSMANMAKKEEAVAEEAPKGPTTEELLAEIRDSLKAR
jgi:large conductance mechanosensitive channel